MNTDAILQAVIDSGVGPLQAETAANLVEAFINSMPKYPDSTWETIAVEQAWWMLLEPKTLIVGVQDRLARDPDGRVVANEWKTKGAPRLKKDGTPYADSDEHSWLDEISSDVQVRIYALAMQHGTYLDAGKLSVEKPRQIVRAIIKANPPYPWPTKPENGVFDFPQPWIDQTRDSLLSAAAQVRAARRESLLPWALPSLHCVSTKYKRKCQYHGEFCSKGINPTGLLGTTQNSTDPGWKAISASGIDPDDPEVVIFSASSYSNWRFCPEQYRILTSGAAPGEESEALQVGKAFHDGVAQVFRELEKERTRKLSLDRT